VVTNNQINNAIFDAFPAFTSQRLHFRGLSAADAPRLFELRTNRQVLQYMDTHPYADLEEAEKAILENQRLFDDKNGITWAITEKGQQAFMGYITFWKLDRKNARAEIGYALLPPYWGSGYMEEGLKGVVRFAFSTLKLHSLEANINPKNKRSERLLIKLGFQKEGHCKEHYWYNGQFLDSVIYSLLEKNLP